MNLVFMGTPKAAVPSLERLISDRHNIAAVYTQPDRPSGRGNRITVSPVKEFALKHGLEVIQPLKLRTPEALELFTSFKADISVVVAYGRILPTSFLAAFPFGAINLHFSLLPKYRGAAPVNWAIANGETVTGVTTMKMDEGLDTGAVLKQVSTTIADDETSIELMDRLSIVGADLLSETLNDLNNITPVEQDHSQATLAPIMRKEDGLIDWSKPVASIRNRIRGFQPFPTSYTLFRGSRLTIWESQTVLPDAIGITGRAGAIVNCKGDELYVECGGGSVLGIRELQPEGKRRMQTRDFINGVHPQLGELMG